MMKLHQRHRLLVFTLILLLIHTFVAYSAISPLAEAIRSIDKRLYYKALNILESYKPKPDELPLYYYIKGKALTGVKRYSEAIEFLNRAYITSKDEELKKEALFDRGRAFLEGGFYYEASSNFKLFISLYPKSENIERAYIYYAQSLLMSGRYQEALRYFKQIKKELPEVIFGKAEVFHRIGLYRTASKLFERGYRLYPKYIQSKPSLLLSYAENLLITGRPERAKPFYYLLTETSLKSKAYLGLGEIEMNGGRLDTALVQFKRARHSADRVIKRKAILNIALIQLKQGQTERAVQNLLDLRENYPYTPEAKRALLELTMLYRKRGKLLEAERFLKELLFGSNPSEQSLRELELLVLDSIEKDRKAFNQIWRECGRFLMTIKRQKTLLKVASTLVEEGGDFLKVYDFLIRNGDKNIKNQAIAELALFYCRLGDAKRASALLKKVKGTKGREDRFIRIKAYLYALKGEQKTAARLLSSIKEPNEADYELLIKIAPLIEPERFAMLYKSFSGRLNKTPDYQLLGDLFYRRGKLSEASSYYRIALKVGDVSPHVLMRLAFIEKDDQYISALKKKGGPFSRYIKESLFEEKIKKSLKEL